MSLPESPRDLLPRADQVRIFWTALTCVALATILFVAALAFWSFVQLLNWSFPILMPLGLAVILALLCKPVVDFLEARGAPRTPTTLAVCVILVAAFVVFWAFILPPVYDSTKTFVQDMPAKFNDASKQILAETSSMPEVHKWLSANLPAFQANLPRYAAGAVSRMLAPVGSAFGFIIGFGFVPIYVFYFVADQDHLAKHWQEFVPLRPGRVRNEAISLLEEFSTVLVSYLRGQIVVAAVNGLLTFIGLSLIGLSPQSFVLGIIAGALSIVPFLGIICSILPALLLAFLSANGDPTWEIVSPLLVLVVFAIVQMTESMFVSPRVQSHSTGLHPLVIILGIIIWSTLLPGLLGPIVAVPLTCAVIVLLRRYVWRDVPRRKRGKEKVES